MNYQRRITNPENLLPGCVVRMITRDRLETEYVAPFSDCIVLEVRIGAQEVDLKRPYISAHYIGCEERFTATFSKLKQQGWAQVFDSHGMPCKY